MFHFEFYHQQSKNLSQRKHSLPPKNDWPESWKTTYIKTYPRFKSQKLPPPEALPKPLSSCLVGRASCRNFKVTPTLEQLSSLLYYSIGEKPSNDNDAQITRMYPSGGARYPLEFYILNFKLPTLETGIYHYDISNHALTTIKKLAFTEEIFSKISFEKFIEKAQFAIVFSATFSRSSEKYGERSYRFALLEAGAVMQNFALCSDALGIGSVSVGGAIDDGLEELIDIDGTQESIVHTMFFG